MLPISTGCDYGGCLRTERELIVWHLANNKITHKSHYNHVTVTALLSPLPLPALRRSTQRHHARLRVVLLAHLCQIHRACCAPPALAPVCATARPVHEHERRRDVHHHRLTRCHCIAKHARQNVRLAPSWLRRAHCAVRLRLSLIRLMHRRQCHWQRFVSFAYTRSE